MFLLGLFPVFFFLSFATGCVVTGEDVKCSCKPGYTGARCERWVPPSSAPPSHRWGGLCGQAAAGTPGVAGALLGRGSGLGWGRWFP